MLRRTLIAASRSTLLRRLASELPAARRVAGRFVAGARLEDALEVVTTLNAGGLAASLDHVGEAVDSDEVARAAADTYLTTLQGVADAGLDASLSVKLSQLGVGVSYELCEELVAEISSRAADAGQHVTVDMEGSDLTEATVELVLSLRARGHDNLGCAVQAYLFRTAADVDRLVASGASLRLCKGAYAEPPRLAHQRRRDVDANYLRLARRLLQAGRHPRFATHDHRLIRRIRTLAQRCEVGRDAYEFQMLYGVRPALQQELATAGHPVRVYVPFGTEWYPYFVRRLAERPANLLFFLRALVSRDRGGDIE